jgi:hypothetical protein
MTPYGAERSYPKGRSQYLFGVPTATLFLTSFPGRVTPMGERYGSAVESGYERSVPTPLLATATPFQKNIRKIKKSRSMVDSNKKKEKRRFSVPNLFRRSLLSTFTPLIIFTASFLKRTFVDPYPFLGGWGAWFFLVTTIGTRFYLFTGVGVYGFLLLTSCVMVLNVENFSMIVYSTFHPSLSATLSSVLLCLDPLFWGFFFFQLIMLDLVLVNTILLSIPQVEKSLVGMCGEEFLADRGFHPPP